MNEFVRSLEKIALSGDDFLKMCNRTDAEFCYFEDLPQKQKLFSNGKKILGILYTVKDQNIGHWVLLWKTKNTIHYFDPYGTSYLKDLDMTHNKDNLSKFLKGYKLVENTYQYQSDKRHINTCTRHIAVRAKFCELDDKNYKTLITIKEECIK